MFLLPALQICHFNENVFPPLGGGKSIPEEWQDITWYVSFLSNLNPRIRQYELEVQMIIHLQGLANQLPNAFTNIKKVIKSHVSAMNTPAHIDVPEGQLKNVIASEFKTCLKHGDLLAQRTIS